ncbi:MAG TPA: hypothetical protein VM031_05225 [Phycisphaerae bacterium]|nr:hypothetical protein [Phycisphaerae bacterium]
MGQELPGTNAAPRSVGPTLTTSPATGQIHCSQPGTQGMTPSSVSPVSPAGQATGAGVELFAQGVKLLGHFSVACALRSALTNACNQMDSQRLVANGGVLISLNIEVSQVVHEPDFPPPPIVKGAYVLGYPANPYEDIRRRLNSSSLVSGDHRNVNLEIYYLWVTPRMLIDRDYPNWPVLARQVIDLSAPSLLQRIFGRASGQVDKLAAGWDRRQAEQKAQADAEARARQRMVAGRARPVAAG